MKNDVKLQDATSSRLSIMEYLLESGPKSRSDLAKKINVTRAALTEISRDLIRAGLLREVAVVRNTLRKGRPSILLSVNPAHGCFVGIDLTSNPHTMVLTNLLGECIDQCEITHDNSIQGVVASVQKGVTKWRKAKVKPGREIRGMGIALSGFVDHEGGICTYSAALNWHDVEIAELVESATGIPTYIDNDANALSVAEKIFGEARNLKNFSVVVLGETIGCAHYIHGQIYRGHNGGAGEIGHMQVVPDGLLCPCGKRGCLDTIAGSSAILATATADGLSVKNVQDVEALASKGNPQAASILRNAGVALGQAVAHLVLLNNPEMILFADLAGFEGSSFWVAARQAIENSILPRFLSSTRLHLHRLDPNFLARGAASVASHKFLISHTLRS